MIQDSLRVPIPAHEASQLADFVFQFAEGRTVDDGLRRMLASRSSSLGLEGMQVHWGSLAADPVAKSTYFVAVDGDGPVLLQISLAASPGSGLFPNSVLVGRMRTPRGLEVVVNASPFAASDTGRIRTYAEQLDRAVLSQPQGVDTLFLAVANGAQTAFQQFRAVQRKYGLSVAAWTGDADEGLWGAIRTGWRDGYAMRGDSEFASRKLVDAVSLTDEEVVAAVGALRQEHGRTFDIDVRFDAPGSLTRPERLAARLEALRKAGQTVRVAEIGIGLTPDAPYPQTAAEMSGWPEDILSSVQWKAAGRPLVELRQRVQDLQETARRFGAIIGITGYGNVAEATLEAIGGGAARRLWYNLGEGLSTVDIPELASLLRG